MGSDKHILLVEDNAATRQSLTFHLKGAGYGVAVAANGRQALDYLRQAEPPFVILLDLTMPVMDGWQFRQEQQHDPALALIPVVLVSGESDLPRVAASLGAAGHCPKPVEFTELLDAIRVVGRNGRKVMEPASSPNPLPELPRPGQWARWRQPWHAHAIGWADAYGPGPFEVVGVVDKSGQGIPAAVVLKTDLGDREVNTVWLDLEDDLGWRGYDSETLTRLLDG
jgi:CheY-like chemotaxis protein